MSIAVPKSCKPIFMGACENHGVVTGFKKNSFLAVKFSLPMRLNILKQATNPAGIWDVKSLRHQVIRHATKTSFENASTNYLVNVSPMIELQK